MKSLSPEMMADARSRRTCRPSRRSWCGCSRKRPSSKSGSRTRAGRYALLKTYPICRWSGELGPKIKEGDRQAPEGFYTITPALMNPNSQFYLSFNMGYPERLSTRRMDRTGAHLMVHGDCSSRGCYAMTDEQIGEIYALARESFFGGQRSFQVQAYPFRMTATNFAQASQQSEHGVLADAQGRQRPLRGDAAGAEGRRLREALRVQRRRAADATPSTASSSARRGAASGAAGQQASLKFNPVGKCPVYECRPT